LKGHYNFSYDHNRGLFATRGVLTTPLKLQNSNIAFIETVNGAVLYTILPDSKICLVTATKPQTLCTPGLFS